MKLTKFKEGHGIYIRCHIGKHYNTSWWAKPPDSIDHVDLFYIHNRYPCVTTAKRAENFKRLYKNLMKEGNYN